MLLASAAAAAAGANNRGAPMPASERLALRETVREMFSHGYENYMRHAFPHDELKPVSGGFTDSLVELGSPSSLRRGTYRGVALTLIDALDTLAVLGNHSEFSWAVQYVATNTSFDLDIEVSVFETNIRVLGGLLSAHLLAAGECRGAEHMAVDGYDGGLLRLAHDLGRRLLGAFDGCDRFPRAFVNLRGGAVRNGRQEQCTAGVGTLLLELGVLSRLTGEPRFEAAALCALRLLWSKRSALNLLGNTLDVASGRWRNPTAGIGAGIDSFYEYLLKGYLVFGRPELYDMWNASYAAVQAHLRHGPWYGEANMNQGKLLTASFDSLQAFWPALQVLVGDIGEAAQTHSAFHALWQRFKVLPERYDVHRAALHGSMVGYPLRPELAESCYALYQATGEAQYLRMGAEMVASLNAHARTKHGFASIRSVVDMRVDDHMTSFFLAETLKYLYLLFDDDNWLNAHSDAYVLTTEAHLIPLSTAFSAVAPAAAPARGLSGRAHVESLPVGQLRELISSAGLAHSDCLEKHELRARGLVAWDVKQRRAKNDEERELQRREAERNEHMVCDADGATAAAAAASAAEHRKVKMGF